MRGRKWQGRRDPVSAPFGSGSSMGLANEDAGIVLAVSSLLGADHQPAWSPPG